MDLALQKIKDLATNVRRREAHQQRLISRLPAGAAIGGGDAGASTPRPPSPGRAGGSADRGDPADTPAPAAPLPPEPVQQVLFPALRAVRTPYLIVDAHYDSILPMPGLCLPMCCRAFAGLPVRGSAEESLRGAVQCCAAASDGEDTEQGLRPACEAVLSRWGRAGALSADELAREALLGGWLAAHHLR